MSLNDRELEPVLYKHLLSLLSYLSALQARTEKAATEQAFPYIMLFFALLQEVSPSLSLSLSVSLPLPPSSFSLPIPGSAQTLPASRGHMQCWGSNHIGCMQGKCRTHYIISLAPLLYLFLSSCFTVFGSSLCSRLVFANYIVFCFRKIHSQVIHIWPRLPPPFGSSWRLLYF